MLVQHTTSIRRQLQAFVIYDPITNQNYTGGAAPPTSDDGTMIRPTTLVGCSQTSSAIVSFKTIVGFVYSVETNTLNMTDTMIEDHIPAYLSGAMIDAVGAEICDGVIVSTTNNTTTTDTTTATNTNTTGTGNNGDANTSNTTSTKNKKRCALTVSAGPSDEYVGTCEPTERNVSKSCLLYEGYLQITHTEDCSSDDIADNTIAILEDAVDTDSFIDDINDRRNVLNKRPSANEEPVVIVTDVDLRKRLENNQTIAGIGSGEYESMNSLNDGISTMAMVLFILLGLILLLLIGLLCWYRRRQLALRRLNELKLQKSRAAKAAFDDDVKSIKTDWSNGAGDDTSYTKPDFYDLGLVHKTVDVHVCRSALCPICAVQKNLGRVQMISVRQDQFVNRNSSSRSPEQRTRNSVTMYAEEEEAPPPLPTQHDKNSAPLHNYKGDDSTVSTGEDGSRGFGAMTMTVIRNLSLVDRAAEHESSARNDVTAAIDDDAPEQAPPSTRMRATSPIPEDGVKYVQKSRWDWARPSRSTIDKDMHAKSMTL
jgi:hypothetical protein